MRFIISDWVADLRGDEGPQPGGVEVFLQNLLEVIL
jgi:hypothetical protein